MPTDERMRERERKAAWGNDRRRIFGCWDRDSFNDGFNRGFDAGVRNADSDLKRAARAVVEFRHGNGHSDTCGIPCSCGFSKLVAALSEALELKEEG